MSEVLLCKLQVLEEEYAGQPLVVQQADLLEINRIRSQIGMHPVDASLNEIGVAVEEAKPKPKPQHVPDHSKARAIYQAYLKKSEELKAHQEYAERVVKATGGPGPTPVRPLATMGTDGGPLLCDHCGKPIVLEGGRYHGVAADVAWKQNPIGNWTSWILGGVVVEIQLNGTLRIYHGYPGQDTRYCCNAASQKEETAQAEFKSQKSPETFHLLLTFLKHEFPNMTEKERFNLLNEIQNTLYSYDPGIGVNRPSRV
ncbi:MAG: hypothetical protein K8U57_20065 [Planctomycetes bacterium]|nr:hypothetical protein [Planctomycetota bacterium]